MLKLNISPTFLVFFMSHDWHKYECRMPVCGGASMTSVESWYLIALKNALGLGMRKGKMRRVSALEVLQCCSAAVLRTPMLCSDQHNTAIWLDMGVGVSGGSLQFILKEGILMISRYDMCYTINHGKSQSRKLAAPTLRKEKKVANIFEPCSQKVWEDILAVKCEIIGLV